MSSNAMKLRAGGERRLYMPEDGTLDKFLTSLSSGKEVHLGLNIIRNSNIHGYLKNTQAELAKKVEVSERTAAKVFKKAKETGLLMPVGRRWYVNPYVALPYNINDMDCNKLQQMWTRLDKIRSDKGKVELKEALLVHEEIFGPQYDKFTGEMK
jgi:hypothetical protein